MGHITSVASHNCTCLLSHLSDLIGEKKKFERPRGGTNNVTRVTLTGDQAIGQMLDSNQTPIPIAIGPFGELGEIFMRFLYGTAQRSLPKISTLKPNAQRALDLATSNKVPSNILGRAKHVCSHREHLEFFDRSNLYLAGNPQIWAEQQLGLALSQTWDNTSYDPTEKPHTKTTTTTTRPLRVLFN